MSIDYDITNNDVSEDFKDVYPGLINTAYDKNHEILQMIKKDNTATGDFQKEGIQLSYAAGVSAGGPATPSTGFQQQLDYQLKKFYASFRLDNFSLALSKRKEGAFLELTELALTNLRKAFARGMASMFWGNGDGVISTVGSVVTNNDPSFVLALSTFKRPQLHRGLIVNFGSSAAKFRITNVDRTNSRITVERVGGGSKVPAAAESIRMEDTDSSTAWTGFKKVVSATSGSLYGLTVQTGWISETTAVASGEPISAPLLEQAIENVKLESGELPNVIACNNTQWKKLKALKEDIETFPLMDVTGTFKLNQGSNLSHFMTNGRAIPILTDEMIDDDEIHLLNTEFITRRTAGDGDFVKNSAGKIFHSEFTLGSDSVLVGFRIYGEYLTIPTYQGSISGLSTTVRA